MKSKTNLPGFFADATHPVAKGNYLESPNHQLQKQGTILMQRKKLPSIMGRKSLSNSVDCGTECKSDDGRESCCCGENKRCVTTAGHCWCENAV
jgi:hypothetical protein